MNLLQAQTLVVEVNAALLTVSGSAYQNPVIYEGEKCLDGLTPFTFARGRDRTDQTLVLNYRGDVVRRYKSSIR